MRIRSVVFLLSIAVPMVLQVGCGKNGQGGGKPNSGGTGDALFSTYTHLSTGVWQNATVTASAVPFTYNCDPYTDLNCTTGYAN